VREVKRKILLRVLVFALLMLFPAIAPVFAAPPTKGTYTQVIVDHAIDPGEQNFQTGDLLHVRGGIGECYLYGGPSSLGNPISSSYTSLFQLNLVSLTGTGIGHVTDTYAAGTVEGIINMKLTGGGSYVYMGPTFTFTLGGVTATVTTGDVFGGILYDIMAVKHGTGDLAGFTLKGTAAGISIYGVIVGDPNMVGMNLSVETGRFSG
jgi:hypothetical protein